MSDILTPKPTVKEVFTGEVSPGISPSAIDINMIPLKGFFHLSDVSKSEQDQLGFIYKHFEKAGATDMPQVLMQLGAIKNSLGLPPFGQTLLQHVYGYIKILTQMADLEHIKIGMQKNG